MPEKDGCASELKEGEVVFGMVFPANDQSSKVVKPGKESFDFPALAVAAQPTAIIEGGLGSSATVRRHQKDFLFEQLLAQWIAIVRFIGNNAQRLFWHQQLTQSGFHQLHFSGRSSFCVDGDWKAMSVSNCHDFAALTPLGFANFSAPFLAAEKLPSTKHSERSSPPRLCKSLAKPCNTASMTPCLRQC